MIENKTILIFGGTGTVGKICIDNFKKNNKIICFSRNEYLQWKLKQKYSNVKYIIGDIREELKIYDKIDYIINCAALKHISTGIENPLEVVKTNILGVQNIIDYALKYEIEKVIQISTDKAVDPINLYGATKMIADELCYKANEIKNIFTSVRFGNVFGSSGSVIEIYDKIERENSKYKISTAFSERYFVTKKQIIELIENAILYDGYLLIGKYKIMRIVDIIRAFDKNAEIQVTGLRPGEKLKEKMDDNYKDIYYTVDEIKELIKEYRNESMLL